MKNKAFIFDWSGTLSDNFHLFLIVCNKIFIDLGRKPLPEVEVRNNFTLPYMKFWNKYFPDFKKEAQDILYEKYIHEAGEPELYPGVIKIINFLHQKDYKIFILSSDPISKLLPEIKKSGFANLITKTMGNVYHKSEAISLLVKNFNLNKKKTFYIGDTTGDVEAGKLAGVITIAATWGFQPRKILAKAKPDFLINNILEIKNLVKKN